MMNQKFAMLRMEMEVVIPHDLLRLAGQELTGDIVRGVGEGHLEAEVSVHLAHPDATLAGVPEYLLQVWLTRLARDTAALAIAREEFEGAEVGDDGRLERPFYAWQIGTPVAEIKAWLREASK